MRVVLLKDVPGVGRRGEVKDVADGHALNYLFPRRLATDASAGQLKRVADARATDKAKKDREHRDAEGIAQRIAATPLAFKLKVGPQGKAFGSVTDRDIAEALKKKGFDIPREQIHLEEPLRSTGVHAVEIRLLSDVRARVTVAVEPE